MGMERTRPNAGQSPVQTRLCVVAQSPEQGRGPGREKPEPRATSGCGPVPGMVGRAPHLQGLPERLTPSPTWYLSSASRGGRRTEEAREASARTGSRTPSRRSSPTPAAAPALVHAASEPNRPRAGCPRRPSSRPAPGPAPFRTTSPTPTPRLSPAASAAASAAAPYTSGGLKTGSRAPRPQREARRDGTSVGRLLPPRAGRGVGGLWGRPCEASSLRNPACSSLPVLTTSGCCCGQAPGRAARRTGGPPQPRAHLGAHPGPPRAGRSQPPVARPRGVCGAGAGQGRAGGASPLPECRASPGWGVCCLETRSAPPLVDRAGGAGRPRRGENQLQDRTGREAL